MKNSVAKTPISRRTPSRKRERIQSYAESHGLTYSEAEERLLTAGLTAQNVPVGPQLPAEVTALYFGPDIEDRTLWEEWRERTKDPHTSWFAHWLFDVGLPHDEAHDRAEAARAARVTPATGTSWVETETATGDNIVFWESDRA